MPASLVVVGVEGPIGVAVGLVVVGGTAAGCCTFVVVVVVGSVPVLVAGCTRVCTVQNRLVVASISRRVGI